MPRGNGMFAVIFSAQIAAVDEEYYSTANRLRELAIHEYGCTKFISSTEGDREIAISYWPSRHHIERWREDPEHRAAQAKGKARWYRSYQVQIAEVKLQYGTDA